MPGPTGRSGVGYVNRLPQGVAAVHSSPANLVKRKDDPLIMTRTGTDCLWCRPDVVQRAS